MAEDSSKKLYVRDVEEWKQDFIKRFSDRELEVKVVEHGIILPARKINGVYRGGMQ